MNYVYTILAKDPATGIAQVQYTPSKASLPTFVREVNLSGAITNQEVAIAVSKEAPFPEWRAIDPSISPTPIPVPFVVDPSRQPPV